jgi:hypothetical protein
MILFRFVAGALLMAPFAEGAFSALGLLFILLA